jgi:hypothetical protein
MEQFLRMAFCSAYTSWPTTGQFDMAMAQCVQRAAPLPPFLLPPPWLLAGEGAREAITAAELSVLFDVWSQHPELVDDVNHMIPLSMAVDAIYTSDFEEARMCVRTFAFMQQSNLLFKCGYAAVEPVLQSKQLKKQLKEMRRCLRKTRTDRGCALYVAKQTKKYCSCLEAIRAANAELPKTDVCAECHVQLPKSEMKRCSKCMKVVYCSRDCQAAQWSEHKQTCGSMEALRAAEKEAAAEEAV